MFAFIDQYATKDWTKIIFYIIYTYLHNASNLFKFYFRNWFKMSLLDNFLKLKPEDWSYNDYSSSRFSLFNLNRTEYTKVKTDFQNKFTYLNVTNLQRVQHPYAYAKYLVRKEHLRTQEGRDPRVRFDFFKQNVGFKESLFRSISSICKYWIPVKFEMFWSTIVMIVEERLRIWLSRLCSV